MRLPRDLDGGTLIERLRKLGYEQTRQTGSHVRLRRKASTTSRSRYTARSAWAR